MLALPEAPWIAKAALEAGRDPLEALGVEGPLTYERGMFLLRLLNPKFAEEVRNLEDSQTLAERVRRTEAWEAALPGGDGYSGERGGYGR